MARITMPLTDTKIKISKAKEKDYKLSDGGGLYLLVTKAGGKHWKLKYRFENKEKKLSLGAYPSISLSKARELREKHKAEIADNINPNEVKKNKKISQEQEELKNHNTFKKIALERLSNIENDISESHYKRSYRGLVNDVFPHIGNTPIDDIIAKDIINVLQIMMKRNIRNSAKQVYHSISKTFKWAVACVFARPV